MAFVVSEGKINAVARPLDPPPVNPIRLSPDVYATYEEIWRYQPSVRTVIGFLARNVAQLGLHVYRRQSDTDRERLTQHPAAKLIDNPLLGSKWTRYRLLYSLMQDLGIYDNAYWAKLRSNGNRVGGLLRLPPAQVTPEGGFVDPEAYLFTANRGRVRLDADQIVHFHGYSPSDARLGVSPMETLRSMLAEEYEAHRYRAQFWRNHTRSTGFIERPLDAPDWSDNARSRFKSEWQARYAGDGPDAGGTPLLEDGMTFKSASISPSDAQYVEARKLTREEVASAYFIAPTMVGILEHATYSNIREQHKHTYQDTLGPWLTMIEEDFGRQILPDLDTDEKVYVEFNLQEKLKGSFEEQSAALQTAVGRPWMTANEARGRMNLDEVEAGDELVIPLNVSLGTQASPTDSAPQPQPDADTDDTGKRLEALLAKMAKWNPALHPRGPNGQFVSAPVGDILRALQDDGGFSYDPRGGHLVGFGDVDGYMIAVPDTERDLGSGGISEEQFGSAFRSVIRDYSDKLNDPSAHVGGWYSDDRDKYIVEISKLHQISRAEAVRIGMETNQEAIIEMGTGTFIDTGGTGDD